MALRLERAWESARARGRRGTPAHFRIEPYLGHGGPTGVVVRGRVVDDPLPSAPVEGEGVLAAGRRTLRSFLTDELPGVPLRVRVAGAEADVVSDADGYFVARLVPTADACVSPWTTGTVALAGDYRGLVGAHTTPVEVRMPDAAARFALISDVDDTILETGVQRVAQMVRRTVTGSALTRTALPGTAELYADLAAEANPVFYVSSSPWNLHGFLEAFLRHRGFPLGPVLLRDLLGPARGPEQKEDRIREILDTHPGLPVVLVGDSGEEDPRIYADVVRTHPGRVLAVYIRETRLDPGDGRVEQVWAHWPADVPFVLAGDSDAMRRHAAGQGLL